MNTTPWHERYRIALRRVNFLFAISAFLLPLFLIGFLFLLDFTGICRTNEQKSECFLLGFSFGHIMDSLIAPWTMNMLTIGCILMSGVGTFIYMVWSSGKK